MMDKTTLRRALLADRQAIAPEVRQQWNAAICERILVWWERHRPAVLGVYLPIRGEPDLSVAYAGLLARGAHLALPAVDAREAPLRFFAWTPGDALTRDALGMPIPAGAVKVQPDALLIPCVGFNAGNVRLGYGGGFYDRTLACTP